MLPSTLIEALRAVHSVGAITGAGLSKASGLPTYRGEGGLYDDPEEGDRTVEALSGTTLRRDPRRTWKALRALALQAQGAVPNDGHRALAEIERRCRRFSLLTQNVDGLHELAGSRNVIAIHGTARATLCQECGERGRIDDFAALPALPLCPTCDGILRPDVVLFGEMLPHEPLHRLHDDFLVTPPDLVLVAGTSALFPYIVEPVLRARAAGKLTVEINPEPTLLSEHVAHSLRGPAEELLPALAAQLPEEPR